MRLIIKEYLLHLIEKDQLDLLLCDLLFLQGYVVDNIPKTGNRQFGVDISAHSTKELLLLVVKKGNINRAVWNTTENSVRESIEEIIDVRLPLLSEVQLSKKIRIIVATNGIMEDTVSINWSSFVKSNEKKLGRNIIIEFWNIDDITKLVQSNLFNEYLLPNSLQSNLRKALYFIEEGDYKHCYYESIIDYYLSLLKDLVQNNKPKKDITKHLSSMFLASQMIVKYAHNANRHKLGININEYLLIKYWQFLLINKLFQNGLYVDFLIKTCNQYEESNKLYFESIINFCMNKECFPMYGEIIEQRLIIYEIIGYLSTFAFYLLFKSDNHNVSNIINTIFTFLNDHSEFFYAPYDSSICQLSILYRLIYAINHKSDIDSLMTRQCNYMDIAYRVFRQYPAPSDSYKEALCIFAGNANKTDYNYSGFWGYMLLWIYLLDNKYLYDELFPLLTQELKSVTKCVWFMRPEEESQFYNTRAMNTIGEGIAIKPDKDYNIFRKQMDCIFKQHKSSQFSFDTFCFQPIEMITCRYFNYVPRVKKDIF